MAACNQRYYNDDMEIGLDEFARAYCPKNRYMMMSNQIAESMNSVLLDLRKLLTPITAFAEYASIPIPEMCFDNYRSNCQREAYRGDINPLLHAQYWVVPDQVRNLLVRPWKAGIDLSTEEMKEPPVDIGINQWYSLYPSRGLRRHKRPKRARIETEDSESKAEGSEPKARDDEGIEEDDNVRLLTQMLKVLKATRSEQADAYAA
ncbi:hypothetical protein LWI28_020681 [Acer negundo]|uniref:Uncharacterized protein n=1 Tax=Acer negundo TaxID=4023 RepID=A0AAD5JAI7_ACENE|nr:hypothetical protein LWI28_020681 [Acer negundo]